MSLIRKIEKRRLRRALRTKPSINSKHEVRISVFRSAAHIYAQAIDDNKSHTLASASSYVSTKQSGTKSEIAFEVGKQLAEKLLEQKVGKVAFARGRYLYHGRVKAFADGLRSGGIIF